MIVDRFFFLDIDFFHKRTCERLADELGPWAVLAFISLIAEAKRSRTPGTITYVSEPDFWQQLGLYGRDLGFDLETFLTLTGRLKQTRRTAYGDRTDSRKTAYGRRTDVILTQYPRWQKDVATADARERKARSRRKNNRDATVTDTGHDRDEHVTEILETRTRSIPLTPFTELEDEHVNGHVERPTDNRRFWGRLTVYATLVERTLEAGDEQNLRASLEAGGGLSAGEIEQLVAYRRELVAAAQSSSEAG